MSVKLYDKLTYCVEGRPVLDGGVDSKYTNRLNESARDNTLAWQVMSAHINQAEMII